MNKTGQPLTDKTCHIPGHTIEPECKYHSHLSRLSFLISKMLISPSSPFTVLYSLPVLLYVGFLQSTCNVRIFSAHGENKKTDVIENEIFFLKQGNYLCFVNDEEHTAIINRCRLRLLSEIQSSEQGLHTTFQLSLGPFEKVVSKKWHLALQPAQKNRNVYLSNNRSDSVNICPRCSRHITSGFIIIVYQSNMFSKITDRTVISFYTHPSWFCC